MNFQNRSDEQKISGGYFGKLPEFPDFVKFNAAGPEILVLDKWIQEGIISAKKNDQTKNEWAVFFRDSSPVNFLFPFTGTGNNLIGTIFPSHDKTGREYPFLIFMNERKNRENPFPPHLLCVLYSGHFNFFKEIFDGIRSGKESLSSVNKRITQYNSRISENEVIGSYRKFLTGTSQKEFRERVLNDENGSFFLSLLNTLDNGLSFLRSRPDASVSFGVKIAFRSIKEYRTFDLAFFLNITLLIAGRISRIPAVFYKQENSGTHLFIFFCIPLPQHFADLFSENIREERLLNANKSLERDSAEPLSANNELKLNDLINNFQMNKNHIML